MTVSLGVHVGQQNLSMTELRALWRRLDSAGVDWISVWDHFYEAPFQGGTQPHYEALATLGALAADTEHARIGRQPTVPVLQHRCERHPFLLMR